MLFRKGLFENPLADLPKGGTNEIAEGCGRASGLSHYRHVGRFCGWSEGPDRG